jgi:hypothetical protein
MGGLLWEEIAHGAMPVNLGIPAGMKENRLGEETGYRATA